MLGILFESNEWSDHKLAAELEARGLSVTLIDMEVPGNDSTALQCELIVNRVFASARFRGHDYSHARLPELLERIEQKGIRLINPAAAHFYEISKLASTNRLRQEGLSVPLVYACDYPLNLNANDFTYPCVIKPDCGGRTTYTLIADNASEAHAFLASAPQMLFIVEEYLKPEKGYLTRVEMIGYSCALIIKRYVTDTGLASYKQGSVYEHYDNPSEALIQDCIRATRLLSFEVGSFDVIERGEEYYFIDANSVSNSHQENVKRLDFDLMSSYANYIASL